MEIDDADVMVGFLDAFVRPFISVSIHPSVPPFIRLSVCLTFRNTAFCMKTQPLSSS